MLPNVEPIDGAATRSTGELLTGDLGAIVVRALLECGVGYVVSSWRDRPTPIDAAVDDARERVLVPRGVVLRRLRSLSSLEPLLTAPTGGVTTEPARGAVVFAGRRGLRPALEQLVRVQSAGAVVGFTFDEDVLHVEDALVIDPEPTAGGLVRAIDAAFAASVDARRPVLVLVRERALGMRGTIRQRAELAPAAAARLDAARRSEVGEVPVAHAARTAGLVTCLRGVVDEPGAQRVVVAVGPVRRAVERSLAEIALQLAPVDAASVVDGIAIVATEVPGVLPDLDGDGRVLLQGANHTCVIGARAARVADRLGTAGLGARIHAVGMDPGTARGERVTAEVARWLLDTVGPEVAIREALEELAASASSPALPATSAPSRGTRVPRRGEVLHRGIPPTVAAGLALAQGVIGVPGRVDASYPTYASDTGVPLTVVAAVVFVEHGVASAAPGVAPGVFLVTGAASGLADAAARAGASIEYVDGGSARAIGQAIGRACRAPRPAPHVIAVAEVHRVAAPRSSTFGMDPELVGTERIATSVVPPAATALVELGDELLAGPTVLVLDDPVAHASLDQLRELSPATWDLSRPARSSRFDRFAWAMRRRIVRAVAGVDL